MIDTRFDRFEYMYQNPDNLAEGNRLNTNRDRQPFSDALTKVVGLGYGHQARVARIMHGKTVIYDAVARTPGEIQRLADRAWEIYDAAGRQGRQSGQDWPGPEDYERAMTEAMQ